MKPGPAVMSRGPPQQSFPLIRRALQYRASSYIQAASQHQGHVRLLQVLSQEQAQGFCNAKLGSESFDATLRQELAQLQQRPELSRQASMRMVEWSLQALQYGALGPSERRMFVSRLLEGITAMSSMRAQGASSRVPQPMRLGGGHHQQRRSKLTSFFEDAAMFSPAHHKSSWKPPVHPPHPGKGPEQPHAAERKGPSVNGHQVPAAASAASAFRAAAGNPAPAALRGGGQAAASPATASPTAPDGPARAAPFEPQHAAAADSRDPRLSRCQVDPETEAAALSFLQADVPATGPHRLILFDLETTGSLNKAERIVEIAAVSFDSGDSYESLVNTYPVKSPQALVDHVHKIPNDMIHQPTVPEFRQVALEFAAFVKRCCSDRHIPVLVAHNGCGFDFPFLVQEYRRVGLEVPLQWPYLDTVQLARHYRGMRKNGLQMLREEFGLPAPAQAHRAMADVKVMRDVLPYLMQGSELPDVETMMTAPRVRERLPSFRGIMANVKGAKEPAQQIQKAERRAESVKAVAEDADVSYSLPDVVSMKEAAQQLERQQRSYRWQQQMEQTLTVEQLQAMAISWQELLQDARLHRGILDVPVQECNLLTPTQRTDFEFADFPTLGQVLQHYPRDYRHYHSVLSEGALVEVPARVLSIWVQPMRMRGGWLKAEVEVWQEQPPPGGSSTYSSGDDDGSGQSVRHLVNYQKVVVGPWAKPKLKSLVKEHPPGSEVTLRGKVSWQNPDHWNMEGEEISSLDEAAPSDATISPVYASTKGVTDRKWRKALERIFAKAGDEERLQQWNAIPSDVTQELSLMPWWKAVQNIHQPPSLEELEQARRRLAFEELLVLQLTLLLRRHIMRTPRTEADLEGTSMNRLDMLEAGRAALPFQLTTAQERVLGQILEDLAGPAPMHRLLQGDVGSGKTAVAFLSMLAAAGSGCQAALMAPTEVLAEQHFLKLSQLRAAMPADQQPSIAILTGSVKPKEKRQIHAALASGAVDLVVGTHALITEKLEYKALGLAVVDEQHRFGVAQRARLQAKSNPPPHVLAMTATPIPRTLALAVHGDMAVCAIDELPPGRLPVITHALHDSAKDRERVYRHIREELDRGGQAFVVCPLVESTESSRLQEIKDAEKEFAALQKEPLLKGAVCGLLHGRMSGEEKAAALSQFASGHTQVLISTTVVEVGVDIPEASVMVVEHAERFGLAQLHQLRGRVGRSHRQSYCYLVTPHAHQLHRLDVLVRSNNGFVIAEADLKDRGPGDFLGKQQSGHDGLKCLNAARLPEDMRLLDQARSVAADLIARHGLNPSQWPLPLLASLKDTRLPSLELKTLPANAIAQSLQWLDDKL